MFNHTLDYNACHITDISVREMRIIKSHVQPVDDSTTVSPWAGTLHATVRPFISSLSASKFTSCAENIESPTLVKL